MTASPPGISRLPGSLVLVGAGKMGGAMLEGWLRAGLPGPAAAIIDPHISDAMSRLAGERGVVLNPDVAGLAPPEVLVLAVKPQSVAEATAPLARLAGPDGLLVSVLAGTREEALRRMLPGIGAIVRAMPNLPASIGQGAIGAHADAGVSPGQRAVAEALLACMGEVEWVPEETLLDAVTGLSGSGPAYLFALVEAMATAGREAGLAPDLAERLARKTVTGAAALLEESGRPAADLRADVTSPGGTTAAGLAVLLGEGGKGEGLMPLLVRTVAAAKRRAAELSV